MNTHTPTPWKIGTAKVDWSVDADASYGSFSSGHIVAAKRRDPICIVVQADRRGFGDGDAQFDANRALIVEAVNSHAANLARIAELEAAAKWQDISTAPKDGRMVLTYVAGLGMGCLTLYWADNYWREPANSLGLKIDPTHWMPLPCAPPSVEDAA